MIPNDATAKQIEAADPTRSTWLSANAGSGKTRVLTDRVARLLLAKTRPENILCLTYTKAAASEMQNRLFQRLGEWAMMPANKLRQDLADLGIGTVIDDAYLREARTLFAAAIEAPGGLKIQTIHSFCAGILRRFPLEAAVSPQFKEMEDRAAEILRDEVLDDMAQEDPDALTLFARHYTGAALPKFLDEIAGRKSAFLSSLTPDELAKSFALQSNYSPADAVEIAFQGGEEGLVDDLVDACLKAPASYQKMARELKALNLKSPDITTLEGVFGLLLYADKSSKSRNWPQSNHTKAVETLAHLADDMHAWMDRTAEAYDCLIRIEAAEKTRALFAFATSFVRRYEAKKAQRGLLDFDDLIGKAKALLQDPLVAQWVLFRLDGGVDHVLVDEAQDTSPDQWDIVRLLTQEFSTGLGANPDRERTVFVVGDKKQSIYSFQGADPEGFDRMRDHFYSKLAQVKKTLYTSGLRYSFRSSDAVLRLVDQTFTADMTEGLEPDIRHLGFKSDMPGRVDLWPAIEKTQKPEDRAWDDPVDKRGETNHLVVLARQIAGEIKRMIATEYLPVKDRNDTGWSRRKITAGDILILVQRRSDLFHEIIAACKEAGLDIAGADRLKLGGILAVKDITAVLAFLALPDDDLSLAAALKSPLFGWSEKELYDLAHPRPQGQSLWEALRKTNPKPATMTILDDLRRQADYMRPYDLMNRLLIRHNGRKNLLARLGHEAEDGIDALLSQALGYEQSDVPSLTGFLSWLATEEVVVKRQPDSAGDRIRVMTVHGAKGLEAPIVILPDTAKRKRDLRNDLLVDENTVYWKPKSELMPDMLDAVKEDMLSARDREQRRLLYVALTRAESWLIIAAAGETGTGQDSWHATLTEAMAHLDCVDHVAPFGPIKRLLRGDWDTGNIRAATATNEMLPPSPAFGDALPDIPLRVSPLSPSELGGAKVMPGEVDDTNTDHALAWGRIIHLLLELLPDVAGENRSALGLSIIQNHPDAGLVPDHVALLAEATALLDAPDLSWLFKAGLAEVPISASLAALGGQRISGIIDRLILSDNTIIAVDYKSNHLTPSSPEDTPLGLIRQMAAYRDALAQIYPSHHIKTVILWTKTGAITELDDETLDNALAGLSLM